MNEPTTDISLIDHVYFINNEVQANVVMCIIVIMMLFTAVYLFTYCENVML